MKQEKKYYFSSDFHCGHTNILKYDSRPFDSIEEHDEAIIKNCMSLFKAEDEFYFLGDFIFGDKKKLPGYLGTLASSGVKMFFIRGNHDNQYIVEEYKKYGTYLGNLEEIKVKDQHIVLCHYAMRIWHRSNHSFYHLYGHSHDNLESVPWGKSMDIGVRSAYRVLGQYKPFEFEEIKAILDKRDILEIDHHVVSEK